MTKCGSIPRHRFCRLAENMSIEISPCSQSIIGLGPENIEAIALSAIDEHHRQIQGGSGNVRKNAPETSVSIVSIPDFPTLCVKRFKYRGINYSIKGLFRNTHGFRALHSGAYLFEHGFTEAGPLAIIRKSRFKVTIEEWLIMLAIPDSKELDRYMVNRIREGWPKEEKWKFLDNLARFMAGLHEYGVFHTDLKTCNILVSDECSADLDMKAADGREMPSICFSLLDYDDVRVQSGAVDVRMRAKNFAQLYLSTPSDICMDDRGRFIEQYLKFCGNINIDKNRLIRLLLARIKGKSLLYVGPEGDISEEWPSAKEFENCCGR